MQIIGYLKKNKYLVFLVLLACGLEAGAYHLEMVTDDSSKTHFDIDSIMDSTQLEYSEIIVDPAVNNVAVLFDLEIQGLGQWLKLDSFDKLKLVAPSPMIHIDSCVSGPCFKYYYISENESCMVETILRLHRDKLANDPRKYSKKCFKSPTRPDYILNTSKEVYELASINENMSVYDRISNSMYRQELLRGSLIQTQGISRFNKNQWDSSLMEFELKDINIRGRSFQYFVYAENSVCMGKVWISSEDITPDNEQSIKLNVSSKCHDVGEPAPALVAKIAPIKRSPEEEFLLSILKMKVK